MMGARIINRRPVALNEGWLDASDIQREGFRRSEELQRSTCVSGKQIARESADHEFQIWWDYRGSDESALSRARAKTEWLKGFRGRGWGSHNPPEESLQEKSWREWQENFARVSADPESASITDLMRAIGYLDKVRSSIQRHAWEQGKKVDADVLAGYENEEQYYQRLIEKKQGRRRNAPFVTRNPPSLGSTARDIYQGWKELAEGPQPPRAVIEGFVPGLGRFDFRNGKIVRLFKETGRRGTVSTYEPATKADIEGIHDAIDKGQFQVEQRTISGAGGVRKFEGAGALEKVFHQATGMPLPEFLETAEGAAWWERMSR